MTGRELAKKLGLKGTKLYYHLIELERNGLIYVVEERTKRNLVEKVYGAPRSFRIDPSLLQAAGECPVYFNHAAGLMESAAAEVRRIASTDFREEDQARCLTFYRKMRLPKEAYDELAAAIKKAAEAAAEASIKDSPDAAAIAVLLYPFEAPKEAL
jgi:sugar-specific transcriptional regulator TrmB